MNRNKIKEREKEVLGAEAKLFSLERDIFSKLKDDLIQLSEEKEDTKDD